MHQTSNDIAPDFRRLIQKIPTSWLADMRDAFADHAGKFPSSTIRKALNDIDTEILRRMQRSACTEVP